MSVFAAAARAGSVGRASVVLRGPVLRRGSCSVQCSAVAVLEFLTSFEQGTILLSVLWVLQITQSVLYVGDCVCVGGGLCVVKEAECSGIRRMEDE